ncbi:hypothetical protein BV25DRAFT_1775306, partial [Artomyces pyxidatus]
PPTLNTLDAVQRTRLIRSARKLGAVLGTTPFLLESDGAMVPVNPLPTTATRMQVPAHSHSRSLPSPSTPTDPSKKSMRRLGSASPTSSVSSLPLVTPRTSVDTLPMPPSFSSKSRRSADAPRPLVLRLNAVPLSPSDPRAQAFPVTPTTAACDSAPQSPLTPTGPPRMDARRRKMARVMRTLGENVPPELVFHKASTPSLELDAGISYRLPPSPRVTTTVTDSCSLADSDAHTPRAAASERWIGEWNRQDIAQVQRELRQMRWR